MTSNIPEHWSVGLCHAGPYTLNYLQCCQLFKQGLSLLHPHVGLGALQEQGSLKGSSLALQPGNVLSLSQALRLQGSNMTGWSEKHVVCA